MYSGVPMTAPVSVRSPECIRRDKPKSVLGFAEAFATARAFLAESAAGKGG